MAIGGGPGCEHEFAEGGVMIKVELRCASVARIQCDFGSARGMEEVRLLVLLLLEHGMREVTLEHKGD